MTAAATLMSFMNYSQRPVGLGVNAPFAKNPGRLYAGR